MLKKVVILLAIIIGLYLVLGFILPNKMQSKATIDINSPIQKIYNEVANLKNWNNWAYWFITDKEMTTTYGADFVDFDSKKHGGAGRLSIVEKKQNEYVKYKIELSGMTPGLADIIFTPSLDGKSVSVEWVANGTIHNIAFKPFYYFVLRPMMSSQFEASLTNLKNITER